MEDQPHYVDLIPKRLGVYWAFFILSLLTIAGFEYLYIEMPRIAEKMGGEYIAAFDLEQSSSLSVWYISTLWFLSGIICIQNFLFTMRNSKLGKYADVWLWGAMGAVFMSLDTTAHLRVLIRDALIYISGTPIFGDGSIWWIGIYIIISGMIGTRILAEMRHYLPACNAFFMAGLGYVLIICIELNLIEVVGLHTILTNSVMVTRGLEMLSNVFLVLSFSLYARHLIFLADPAAFTKWYARLWKSQEVKPARILTKNVEKEIKDSKAVKENKPAIEAKKPNEAKDVKEEASPEAIPLLLDDFEVNGIANLLNKEKNDSGQKLKEKDNPSKDQKQNQDPKVSKYVFKSR